MKYGPFSLSIARSLTQKLERLGVPYEVEEDRELLQHEEQAWKNGPEPGHRRGPTFDPAFLFLHVSGPEAERNHAALAELGLAEAPAEDVDFSKEEYVCPTCDRVVSQDPGICYTHGKPLLPWSEHIAAKRATAAAPPPIWAIGLVLLLVSLLVWIVSRQ